MSSSPSSASGPAISPSPSSWLALCSSGALFFLVPLLAVLELTLARIRAGFQYKLSVAALVFGWGMAQFAILINTVAVYNYLNNCFPTRQGEVSALVNFA